MSIFAAGGTPFILRPLFADQSDVFRYRVAMLALLLFAAVLRCGAIGRESLWYDETLTLASAKVPFRQIIHSVIDRENLPPLYFILINRWAFVFGTSDLSLRFPSLIFGVVSVAVIYLLCQQLGGNSTARRTGLAAALLLTVSRHHIMYSQQARPYSLELLLCLISCERFAQVVRSRGTPAVSAIYVIASSAALWTQPFAGLVFLAQDLYLLFTWQPARKILILQGAILLSYWPWLQHLDEVYRIGQPWMPMPSIALTVHKYADTWPIAILISILGIVALWQGLRRKKSPSLLALLLLTIPILIPIMASTQKRVLFIPRYGFTALIGGCWLGALGIVATGRRIAPMLLILVFVLAAPNLFADFWQGVDSEPRADIKHAAAFIDQSAKKGDGVCCLDMLQSGVFTVYSHRPDLTRLEAVPTFNLPSRLWLVTPNSFKDIDRTLAGTRYQLNSSRAFTGIKVFELQAN